MLRSIAIGFALLAVLLVVRPAAAQQISASVDADRVEVGDTFSYSLAVAVSGGAMPSDPQPGAVTGFTIVGASSSPMQMHMNMNGAASTVNSLTTTWSLRANKVGTFALGPASAIVNGSRRAASPVRVIVVPRGQGGGVRGRHSPFGGSPFDPFANSPFRGLFGIGEEPQQEALKPTADPKLNLDEERGAVAFLHAMVDKTHAVVGEQVTLNVYLYADPYARPVRVSDVHEATVNDFVKRSLIEDESRAIDLGTALVGGRIWSVKLVRKNALFPLKTGRLEIEPMSLTLAGAPSGRRQSEALHVDVTEPPVAGRPPGYAVGDVGDFALSATVSPRSVDQGGAVGVTLEIRGTGNIPEKLTLPVVRGVEWLDASSHDKLGAVESDRFGGTRTFSYVVRFREPGAVDLGEIRLPFYNADKKTYVVAHAPLGIVEVRAGATHDAGAPEPEPVLANLPAIRRTLEGRTAERFLSDRAWFWALVLGLPVACVLAISATSMLRRAREHRAERAPSPERVAKARRAEAKAACEGDDAKAALGAVVRAIVAVVSAETGVNLRGVSADTARGELRAAGVGDEATNELLAALRACEDAQFSPDGASISSVREMWARVEAVLGRIESEAQ
ncbi:MAG: BatD family protein [Polyangiaceae bacterium]|nr:BatD family protein [Polyangiaceae bacterium]